MLTCSGDDALEAPWSRKVSVCAMNTENEKKQQLYQQQGKKLISFYPDDKPRMRELLLAKLEKLR